MSHLDNLISNVPSLPKGKVLDLGSGRGKFLIQCATRGIDATGLEFNGEKVKFSQEQARQANVQIKALQGTGEHMPFADQSFDFANCAEVIEHVQDPTKVMQELFRVLKPGAKAYMSVSNRFGAYDGHFHMWFINWMPRLWADKLLTLTKLHKNYHSAPDRQSLEEMYYYTYKAFKNFANSNGFTVEDIRELKIKRRFGKPGLFFFPPYWILRTIYFTSFHLILTKPS